jgi:hypothetical protein
MTNRSRWWVLTALTEQGATREFAIYSVLKAVVGFVAIFHLIFVYFYSPPETGVLHFLAEIHPNISGYVITHPLPDVLFRGLARGVSYSVAYGVTGTWIGALSIFLVGSFAVGICTMAVHRNLKAALWRALPADTATNIVFLLFVYQLQRSGEAEVFNFFPAMLQVRGPMVLVWWGLQIVTFLLISITYVLIGMAIAYTLRLVRRTLRERQRRTDAH